MAESGQNMDKQSEGSSVSETINKQGWLSKRSRLYKRWDKRWCCLRKNELTYGITAEVSSCEALIIFSPLTYFENVYNKMFLAVEHSNIHPG